MMTNDHLPRCFHKGDKYILNKLLRFYGFKIYNDFALRRYFLYFPTNFHHSLANAQILFKNKTERGFGPLARGQSHQRHEQCTEALPYPSTKVGHRCLTSLTDSHSSHDLIHESPEKKVISGSTSLSRAPELGLKIHTQICRKDFI